MLTVGLHYLIIRHVWQSVFDAAFSVSVEPMPFHTLQHVLHIHPFAVFELRHVPGKSSMCCENFTTQYTSDLNWQSTTLTNDLILYIPYFACEFLLIVFFFIILLVMLPLYIFNFFIYFLYFSILPYILNVINLSQWCLTD